MEWRPCIERPMAVASCRRATYERHGDGLLVAIVEQPIGTIARIICGSGEIYLGGHLMLREIKCIAGELITGSDNFLQLVKGQGAVLDDDKNVLTRLGWFSMEIRKVG